MKLADHVEHIRKLIDKAFRNRLGRMGVTENNLQIIDSIPIEYREERKRIEGIREIQIAETRTEKDVYEKLVEEFTFTLFNRIAALKVMEAHTLHPEIITRRNQYGDRSFAHYLWLEQNSGKRNQELEGLLNFIEYQLETLASDIPLFSLQHPYHLLPTAIELNNIITAFNNVEQDPQVESNIWSNDDVLGWLYESYNNAKKEAHKESGDKTEYDKVSIQSQWYTPRWVVKFLVDNSLGKLYLEMFPDSGIKVKHKIANAPEIQTRGKKPLTEIKMIDPATGSGNFVLYGFDLFYDLYIDQINNYSAAYDEAKIPELIIRNNLYGIDLDDRAVQLAQLGLYIKAKRKNRNAKIERFNIVSSDFFLPEYEEVKQLFLNGESLNPELEKIVKNIWSDLQQAYKFGSLIRLEEKFSISLQGLVSQFEGVQMGFFTEENLAAYEHFKDNFFANLQKAVAMNTAKQGITFLNSKTKDAITFLKLLTQNYDVAVANPPYTDSSDYGLELKVFVDSNYKKPYKFHSNLYSTFIKRCTELVVDNGYIGMLHPLTFMYITSFKDVRKYILAKTHIEILAELGLGGVFASSDVQADVVAYILKNSKDGKASLFLDFKKYKNHTNKSEIFNDVYKNLFDKIDDNHIYSIDQNKFMAIADSPFIYWISDRFRAKFIEKPLNFYFTATQGMATSNNERFIRFWWEVDKSNVSINISDKLKWKPYSKGGPFNRWFGNNWVLVNWENDGFEIKNFKDAQGKQRSAVRNEEFYMKEGITYTASGSKGASFRLHPENSLFDVGGSCIFSRGEYFNYKYLLAFLNSKLAFYIVDSLNPTVNTTQGDISRIPFLQPESEYERLISQLSENNINIKKELNTYQIVENNFERNPLQCFSEINLKDRVLRYFDYRNAKLATMLINEAIINHYVFKVYNLSPQDREQVESKMGSSVGDLPLLDSARKEFLTLIKSENVVVENYIKNLPSLSLEEDIIHRITQEYNLSIQTHTDLEELCTRHGLNPINLWYWIKKAKVLPHYRALEITLEYLADVVRTILLEDEDGIIPLVGLAGEPRLLDRIEQHCLKIGFTSAHFMQIDNLLGKPLNEYLEHYFFINLSDHIKLFKQLPATPFIWHLSSGEHQGFEVYIIIYKWNRDSLFKLKSHYLTKRIANLEYRQIQSQDSATAQAQNEKEIIRMQLQEISVFAKKVDELIAESYDPKLDDGVGKNIAPLQKKGMLRHPVLNAKQLEKYLNADW